MHRIEGAAQRTRAVMASPSMPFSPADLGMKAGIEAIKLLGEAYALSRIFIILRQVPVYPFNSVWMDIAETAVKWIVISRWMAIGGMAAAALSAPAAIFLHMYLEEFPEERFNVPQVDDGELARIREKVAARTPLGDAELLIYLAHLQETLHYHRLWALVRRVLDSGLDEMQDKVARWEDAYGCFIRGEHVPADRKLRRSEYLILADLERKIDRSLRALLRWLEEEGVSHPALSLLSKIAAMKVPLDVDEKCWIVLSSFPRDIPLGIRLFRIFYATPGLQTMGLDILHGSMAVAGAGGAPTLVGIDAHVYQKMLTPISWRRIEDIRRIRIENIIPASISPDLQQELTREFHRHIQKVLSDSGVELGNLRNPGLRFLPRLLKGNISYFPLNAAAEIIYKAYLHRTRYRQEHEAQNVMWQEKYVICTEFVLRLVISAINHLNGILEARGEAARVPLPVDPYENLSTMNSRRLLAICQRAGLVSGRNEDPLQEFLIE